MTALLLAQANSVLASLPGWRDARLEPLHIGQTPCSWLVTGANGRGILKIDPEPRVSPFIDRLHEQRLQDRAASEQIAARTLYADATTYFTEYVDGEPLTSKSLSDGTLFAQLVPVLKRLHALPVSGLRYNPLAAARRYAANIRGSDSRTVEHCLNTIAETEPKDDRRFCHNDLVAENIIAGNGIRLIDFEYACDNTPLFDLATLIEHHNLSADTEQQLLSLYFEGRTIEIAAELGRQKRRYNALYWLWLAERRGTSQQRDRLEELARRL